MDLLSAAQGCLQGGSGGDLPTHHWFQGIVTSSDSLLHDHQQLWISRPSPRGRVPPHMPHSQLPTLVCLSPFCAAFFSYKDSPKDRSTKPTGSATTLQGNLQGPWKHPQ